MKLTLLLIPLIWLSSCTIDWNDEKDKKITELEKQVIELKEKNDDELFKKQQECQSYLWKMQDSDSFSNFGDENWIFINRIFYSEVKNTCIYQSKWNGLKWNKLWIWQCFLTKNILTNEEYDNQCFTIENMNTWEIEKAEEKYDNLYENWRSIENFDKVIGNLGSETSNQ